MRIVLAMMMRKRPLQRADHQHINISSFVVPVLQESVPHNIVINRKSCF